MNSRKIIIALIAVLCTALAAYSLKDSMRTYVPAREAMERGRPVQVIGTLDKSVPIRHTEDYYTFSIIDKEGTHLAMRHRGARPVNMEHADQVVAQGNVQRRKRHVRGGEGPGEMSVTLREEGRGK